MQYLDNIIFDTSAILALINLEKGHDTVRPVLDRAIMSTVNVAEVAKFLIEKESYTRENVSSLIESTLYDIIPFTTSQAITSAEIIKETRPYGLSLGDRACIALSMETGYPIYTADRIWEKLSMNLDIVFVR